MHTPTNKQCTEQLVNKHLIQQPTNLHNLLLANKHNPLTTYTIHIQCNNMTSTNNLMPKKIPTKTMSTKQQTKVQQQSKLSNGNGQNNSNKNSIYLSLESEN
jgi:hypothetical protein